MIKARAKAGGIIGRAKILTKGTVAADKTGTGNRLFSQRLIPDQAAAFTVRSLASRGTLLYVLKNSLHNNAGDSKFSVKTRNMSPGPWCPFPDNPLPRE